MPPTDDQFRHDVISGFAGMVPVIGPPLAPFVKRMSEKVQQEWLRNHSKALAAAERASGMSREELADAISEDPRLIPLVTRVLFAAGMTGQDSILAALGVALGDAVRDRSRIDEAELLLIGIADLRTYHIAILKIMSGEPPAPGNPDSIPRWYPSLIADTTGYRSEVVSLCIYGLISSGLVRSLDTYGGTSYEITELGRTALEVVAQLNEDDPGHS